MNYVRRFVFVHYEDLLEVRFRQLEKVTDKLYVFVPGDTTAVPFALVRQVQEMGRDLVWVDVGESDYAGAQLLMAFYVGQLHAQADPGVEFALVSDAPEVDTLVAFVQSAGREAIRVRRRPRQSGTADARSERGDSEIADADAVDDGEEADGEVEDLDLDVLAPTQTKPPATEPVRSNGHARANGRRAPLDRGARSVRTLGGSPAETSALAEEIVRGLIRSGQRPGTLSELRSYVALHDPAGGSTCGPDEVVAAMVRKREIALDGEGVRYGF